MASEPLKYFISYNHADRTWAEWIAWQLEAAGHRTVIQAWDIRPGENFVLEMQTAVQEANRTIAVLSPNYLEAEFTQAEWAAAFQQDPQGKNHKLVPVRVRDCKPEGILGPIVYIDLVGVVDRDEARIGLLEGLLEPRGKPDEEPAFPGDSEGPPYPGRVNSRHERSGLSVRIIGALVVFALGLLSALLYLKSSLSRQPYVEPANGIEVSDTPSSSEERTQEPESVDRKVYRGVGSASISYQCDPETEDPCPPDTELTRRAFEVAKIVAMKNISAAIGVGLESMSQSLSGRLKSERITTESGAVLSQVEIIEESIAGDVLSVTIEARVRPAEAR